MADSPGAGKQFPWLSRQGTPRAEPAAPAESALAAIKKTRALAASPRIKEQFPELARGEEPSAAAPAKSGNGESELARVVRNRALAASPRMREQYPELARGYAFQPATESFEIPPLK